MGCCNVSPTGYSSNSCSHRSSANERQIPVRQISHLVMFDDGAYSGMQMEGYLYSLQSLLKSSNIRGKMTINAIIPFVRERRTLPALTPPPPSNGIISTSSRIHDFLSAWMTAYFEKPPLSIEMNLFNSQSLPTSSLSVEELKTICAPYVKGEKQAVAYFDHKIADSISVCKVYHTGKVWNMWATVNDGCEEEASLSAEERAQKEVEYEELLSKTDTKFIDVIHPPYKSA